MTKAKAARILSGFFLVFFGAILLRVDYFPFTWVPMYGERGGEQLLEVTVGDLEKRAQGLRATRADGTATYLDQHDLNMPPANFRRLYNERMFGEGPPQDRRERMNLSAFNAWWYDRLIGPQDLATGRYQRGVLESVNKTLGLGPADPQRIVRLEAEVGRLSLSREERDRGEINAAGHATWRAVVTPAGTTISTVAR